MNTWRRDRMLYLDANFFLTAAQGEDTAGFKAREILSAAATGTEKCVTSALTWDEIFWTIKKKLGTQKAVEQSERFMHLAGVEIVAADSQIIMAAHELCAKYNLDPRDAIHVATAITYQCKTIVSSDHDLDKVKEIKRKQL